MQKVAALTSIVLLTLASLAHAGETLKFIAVGDVLLDRGVRGVMEYHGLGEPLKHVREIIKDSDLAFFNLETAVSESGTPRLKAYTFRAEPAFLNGVAEAGFNIASVANNHTMDFGLSAFNKTISALAERGIRHVGLSNTPLILEQKGLRLAMLAYTEFDPGAGSKTLALADPERLKEDIAALRNRVDMLIVSFHWGIEGSSQPAKRQVALAHAAVDAGADLIIGHHPHVLQGVEIYKDRLILYSLGNFVFDNSTPEQSETVIFTCKLEKGRIISPQFIPVMIERSRPKPAEAGDFDRIYTKLSTLSIQNSLSFAKADGKVMLLYGGSEVFEVPLKSYKMGDRSIVVYPWRVDMFGPEGDLLDTLKITDPERHIREAELIVDQKAAALYVIYGEIHKPRGDRIGYIGITPEGKFEPPAIDSHRGHNPWKIMKCDVDGDHVMDLCVGVWKGIWNDPREDNRPFVYNREGNSLYPKWFGSRLALPFSDLAYCDVDSDGSDELLALETIPGGSKRLTAYSWRGFGFTGDRVLEGPTTRTELTSYCRY